MGNGNVSLDTFSNAMNALSVARSNQVVRSQQEYAAAGQTIQADTGMPPLSEFFVYQAEEQHAQGLIANPEPSFVQQFMQELRALKTPAAAPDQPASHIDVMA